MLEAKRTTQARAPRDHVGPTPLPRKAKKKQAHAYRDHMALPLCLRKKGKQAQTHRDHVGLTTPFKGEAKENQPATRVAVRWHRANMPIETMWHNLFF